MHEQFFVGVFSFFSGILYAKKKKGEKISIVYYQ